MSLELFDISHGISISAEDFSTKANIIQGNGLPGGDGAVQDQSTIGSLYLRTDQETNNLQVFWKYRTTQNSNADWQQVVSKEFLSSVINGISWREPVAVLDETVYADAASLPVGGVVDGVTLADGDRVLFSNVTAGNSNVYIWDLSGSSWTEDLNVASEGDTLLIKEGTSQDEQWTFDSSDWIHTGGTGTASELGYLRDFVGKDGIGSETPNYTSTLFITQGISLEAAIGSIDSAVGTLSFTEDNFVVDGDALTTNVDKLDIQLGTGTPLSVNIVSAVNDVTENFAALDAAIADRNYTNTANHILDVDAETVTASLEKLNVGIGSRVYSENNIVSAGEVISTSLDNIDIQIGSTVHTSTNIISDAASINVNLSGLDAAIGPRAYTNDFVLTDGQTVTASLDALDAQFGSNTFTQQNVVSDTNNVTENLEAIDLALNTASEQVKVVKTANVGAQTAVDSLPIASAEVAKWVIGVENTLDATNRYSAEIHAIHDGTTADHNRFSVVKTGGNITGLQISVDINAGSLRLLVTSAVAVDVAVRRVGFFTIN